MLSARLPRAALTPLALAPLAAAASAASADLAAAASAASADPAAADPAAPVRAAWQRHFGPLPPGEPWVSAAGRVALPFARRYSAAELEAEAVREGLDTPQRRERAWVAEGPRLPGHTAPAYAHFLGSDPPGTDTWGAPALVAALIDVSATWFAACAEGREDPAPCTVQVGDLAWPAPVRPDPLGHADHDGTCVDLRLFRRDGSRYEAWWDRPDDRPGRGACADCGYDPELTAAFLLHARARLPLGAVYFNDPAVRARVPGVEPRRGHDDHVHLCLAAPPRSAP